MKKRILFILIAVVVLLVASIPASAQGPSRSFIVMAANQLPANFETRIAKIGGTVDRLIPQIGIAVVSSSEADFSANAARLPGIASVMPNVVVNWLDPLENIAFEEDYSNPPFSDDDDFFFDLQWGHTAVNAPAAWNVGIRGAGVRVAVLDGGFDLDHPDLAPNINFALSQDFTGEGLQYGLPDTFSHGSHTAGTVAAADNGFGTIGVAPEAELVLVKVLGDSGSGSFADVIAGIVYAADVDADVISMSLGATLPKSGWCDEDGCVRANEVAGLLTAIDRATTYAYQMGSTVIAAAGNDSIDFDHTADIVHTPSSGAHVLSISATAPVGWATDPGNSFLSNLASYSNYGQSAIDFAAPGGDAVYPGNEACLIAGLVRPCWVFDLVFSTGNGGWYWSAGTSMATPHAAGVAALIIGANGGEMKPAQVEAAMRSLAADLGKPGNDDAYGSGLVQAPTQ